MNNYDNITVNGVTYKVVIIDNKLLVHDVYLSNVFFELDHNTEADTLINFIKVWQLGVKRGKKLMAESLKTFLIND